MSVGSNDVHGVTGLLIRSPDVIRGWLESPLSRTEPRTVLSCVGTEGKRDWATSEHVLLPLRSFVDQNPPRHSSKERERRERSGRGEKIKNNCSYFHLHLSFVIPYLLVSLLN